MRLLLQALVPLCLFVSVISYSVKAQTHTPKTVSVNTNCKGYYEYLPVGYTTSTKAFPLLIYCGGAGSFGNGTAAQLSRILTEGVAYYINNNQFPASINSGGENNSFIVISPQFVAWPTPTDVEAVLNFIISQGYKVDASRVYLSGFSAGGDVSWKFSNSSVARSKRLAAMVPVAPFINPYIDSGAKHIAAAGLPVWALHSNADQVAPAYWSQNFVNKVNSLNPAVAAKITRFDGVQHDPTKLHVYNPTYRPGGLNIYEWMLLYRRSYPPAARAGADVSLFLPQQTVQLNGTASSDPEGSALTYTWRKVGGPSVYSIANSNSAIADVSGLVGGNYLFELKVTDADGFDAVDTVAVSVVNSNGNVLPAANAGNDLSINRPQNTVTLDGSQSTDAGGSIEQYRWTQLSGPAVSAISQPNNVTTSVSNLVTGKYVFKLEVTDNEGGVATDVVEVTVVNPYPNQQPVARAGGAVSFALPQVTTTLNGSASYDADGQIIAYYWQQTSGPGTATLASPNASQTAISLPATPGTYSFSLTVTDDSAATNTDVFTVTLLPAPVTTTRLVRINLFGGANAYSQEGWNNWNVTGTSNITSGNFLYSDGAPSGISALLNYSQGVPDNGASYGGTVCPAPVLRYTSYSTASNRTLTLRGLNTNATYEVELYASRANSGNTTLFVINGITRSVVTDHNKTNAVVFTNVRSTNGQLVININKQGTFTYINGLIIREQVANNNTLNNTLSSRRTFAEEATLSEQTSGINVLSNPFRSTIRFSFTAAANGNMLVTLRDANGIVYLQERLAKNAATAWHTLRPPQLSSGLYYLTIYINGQAYQKKLLRE